MTKGYPISQHYTRASAMPTQCSMRFDILEGDGEDYRDLPLFLRKTNLAALLDPRPDGLFVASYEQGEIGPKLFEAACKLGIEGLVSKHRENRCRAGRCPRWSR